MTTSLEAIDNSKGQATRRILRLFQTATPDEIEYGLRWYQDAHTFAADLAAEYGTTVDIVAGVIAALSPQVSWPQNKLRARQLLATGSTVGFTNGRRKAQRIVAGEAPLDVLSGPKTRAFYSNLADPTNSAAVTIDRHALDAAAGQVLGDRARRVLDRKGEYERIADIYRSAALTLGVAPHVVQAVVWVAWRNQFALDLHKDETDPTRDRRAAR